jgi:hypothetical protein
LVQVRSNRATANGHPALSRWSWVISASNMTLPRESQRITRARLRGPTSNGQMASPNHCEQHVQLARCMARRAPCRHRATTLVHREFEQCSRPMPFTLVVAYPMRRERSWLQYSRRVRRARQNPDKPWGQTSSR